MPLIKNGEITADVWTSLADDAPVPGNGAVIVSAARWTAEKDALAARGAPIGIRLASSDRVEDIEADLASFGVVVLEFPAFTDGRAYSTARLLRDRDDYTGEIRAAGNVLFDQLAFMTRCGFDAFDVDDSIDADAWKKALAEVDVKYQPAADNSVPAYRLRHGR